MSKKYLPKVSTRLKRDILRAAQEWFQINGLHDQLMGDLCALIYSAHERATFGHLERMAELEASAVEDAA